MYIMYLTGFTSIINLTILSASALVKLIATLLIAFKRHDVGSRSWLYLLIFFTTSTFASMGEIILILTAPAMLDAYKLLHPLILVNGFLIFAILMFYLLELMNPFWLTRKRIVLLMLPWLGLMLSLVIFECIDNTTTLYRINDIAENLHQADIYLRMVLSMLFLPYVIWLSCMRYNWRRSLASRPYLIGLLVLTALLGMSYIGSRGLQLFPIYIIHESLYLILTLLILYMEYYERLHIPLETIRSYYTPLETPHLSPSERTLQHTMDVLKELMDTPEVWQNPELVRDDLVVMAGSNRTYIELVAKRMGFKNLSDMVHRRRIDYACQQLRANPDVNLQALFYDAGYRSRTTAWRHFVEIVGCTPTEFIEKNTPPPKNAKQLNFCNLRTTQLCLLYYCSRHFFDHSYALLFVLNIS